MKKIILSLTIVLAISISSFAQDVIYKKDGTEIKGMVIEITKDVIKYYKFTQQSGPIRKIDISEVFIVIYEDGSQEVFKKNEPSQDRIQSTPLSKEVESPRKQLPSRRQLKPQLLNILLR